MLRCRVTLPSQSVGTRSPSDECVPVVGLLKLCLTVFQHVNHTVGMYLMLHHPFMTELFCQYGSFKCFLEVTQDHSIKIAEDEQGPLWHGGSLQLDLEV